MVFKPEPCKFSLCRAPLKAVAPGNAEAQESSFPCYWLQNQFGNRCARRGLLCVFCWPVQQHGLESQWLKWRLFLSLNVARTWVYSQDQATRGSLPQHQSIAISMNVIVYNAAVSSIHVCYYHVCEAWKRVGKVLCVFPAVEFSALPSHEAENPWLQMQNFITWGRD